MKTRNGFVSNSSSSSFVIGLDKVPASWQGLHELLFGSMDDCRLTPDWYKKESTKPGEEPYGATSHEIAKNIFNQIIDQDPVSNAMLKQHGMVKNYPSYRSASSTPEGRKLQKKKLERYGSQYGYSISPTNRLQRREEEIDEQLRKAYHREVKARQKEYWTKQSQKFEGLKKFIIMTQTDGGTEGRVLAIMEYCWSIIMKNVKNVKFTNH